MGDALARIQTNPKVAPIYSELALLLQRFARFDAEIRVDSIVLVSGKEFLEVFPKQNSLILKIITEAPIGSARLKTSKKAGRRRYLTEVEIKDKLELDDEIMRWVKFAYDLTPPKS
jgi:hypothetical protein